MPEDLSHARGHQRIRQRRHRRVPRDQVHRDGHVTEPLTQFQAWYEHAVAAGVVEPEAMALATATPEGVPSVRFVLLKGIDEITYTLSLLPEIEAYEARLGYSQTAKESQ